MRAAGGTELARHLAGGKLTRGAAIKAKCYSCMGNYDDGRRDCLMPKCPLHPFMKYKGKDEHSNEE